MRNIVVIHHSADWDGLFCREIAKLAFGDNAQYIGWDYGQPELIVPDNVDLYMLDISVPSLMNHSRLTWIDHHKSAMERYGRKSGYQIDGVAACRLAWQFFCREVDDIGWPPLPEKQDFAERRVLEPWAVRLAGEYDIWDKRDPDAELFQHGLRSRDLETEWGSLLQLDEKLSIKLLERYVEKWGNHDVLNGDGSVKNGTVRALLEAGKGIQYAKAQEDADIVTSYGFDLVWEGLTFLACNQGRYNSLLFRAGLKQHHDACFGFNWDGQLGNWRVSLYHAPVKEHHDLSAIAVKYGGGGHRGACGFRVDKLPFLP